MFNGPVFIVGRPRSGTKLLRELLNRHSRISIPFWESAFIPSYARMARTLGKLDDEDDQRIMIDWLSETEFFKQITGGHGYQRISKMWLSSVTDFSYAGVVSALFKLYASCEGKDIWGDKCPHYMLEMPLLKQLFPSAKFIHIIRDVRDNCLSNQKAWGKNPLRSAQLWIDSISKCRDDSLCFSGDYHEIKYESLLTSPEAILREICHFLKIAFEPEMASLARPVENLGDTQGANFIVSYNMKKWGNGLSTDVVEKIEEISLCLLEELGYPVIYAKRQIRLTPVRLALLKGVDAWNRLNFDCGKEGSIVRGVVYQYRKRRFS